MFRRWPVSFGESSDYLGAQLHQPLIVDWTGVRLLCGPGLNCEPLGELVIILAGQQDPHHKVARIDINSAVVEHCVYANTLML
ncbi:hypothetical protein MAHJHV63_51370 [Mycobacterium avium subsp. hominissuis]